jgi:hypothetical protein
MKNIEWSKWASIAEIVSSVAILITLVYLAAQTQQVAIQTQQNSAAINASSRQAVLASDLELLSELIAYPSINEAMVKDELSYDEMTRLENWLVAMSRSREHQWFQYRDGLLDEQVWEAYLTGLTVNLRDRRTRAWWERFSYQYFDDDFVDEINVHLAGVEVRDVPRHAFEIIDSEPE